MVIAEREAVSAWPRQGEAADIVGVDPSRLTRWLDHRASDVEWREGEKRVRPTAILEFAEQHRFAVVSTAAKLLTQLAEAAIDDTLEQEIADEINDYLDTYERRRAPKSIADYERILADLRHLLPPHLYREVAARLPSREQAAAIVGATEESDDD